MLTNTLQDSPKYPIKHEPVGVVKDIEKTTKDLYLAAALHAEGCKYLKADKSDPTRIVFVFEGGENAERVEQEWRQGILVVSATAYAQSIRQMKSIVHS